MLILRFLALVLAVVAAAVVAGVTDSVWLTVVALVLLVALSAGAVLLVLHYLGSPDWLGGSEETQLADARLVEAESGLPTRRRWNERQARAYAEEVARRGLVAVPEGWRGPDGAFRVLLVATAPVSAAIVREHLGARAENGLAVLVVVPTLGENAEVFHRGDAVEAVEHAEAVAREQVALLDEPDIAVSAHIGPADPAVAISDGLRTYGADIVVVARRHGRGVRHLEDVPVEQAAGIFGVALTEIDMGAVPQG